MRGPATPPAYPPMMLHSSGLPCLGLGEPSSALRSRHQPEGRERPGPLELGCRAGWLGSLRGALPTAGMPHRPGGRRHVQTHLLTVPFPQGGESKARVPPEVPLPSCPAECGLPFIGRGPGPHILPTIPCLVLPPSSRKGGLQPGTRWGCPVEQRGVGTWAPGGLDSQPCPWSPRCHHLRTLPLQRRRRWEWGHPLWR